MNNVHSLRSSEFHHVSLKLHQKSLHHTPASYPYNCKQKLLVSDRLPSREPFSYNVAQLWGIFV